MQIFKFYLIFINLLTFVMFAVDKLLAKYKKWRVPESRLLLACLIGGSLGGLFAMQMFRHKTLNPKFKVGVPAIILLQLAVMLLIFKLAYL